MKSFRTTLTFARVAGIPLRVHLNWFITAALVTWSLAVGYFPQVYPDWPAATSWLLAFATMVFFFLSVLLHELGHAVVAMRDDVPVRNITLFILGGVANIAHEPRTPESEFRIVAAGPMTSMLLAGFFTLAAGLFSFSEPAFAMTIYLSRINVILAVFNMLPGFPLDGGRILRAALWRGMRDFRRATRWASNAGIGIALLFLAGGLYLIWRGELLTGVWIGFIGWYLAAVAQQGQKQAELEYEEQDAAEQAAAAAAMAIVPQAAPSPFERRDARHTSTLTGESVQGAGQAPLQELLASEPGISARRPCPEPCPK